MENDQREDACRLWQQAIDGAREENAFLDKWLAKTAFKVEALINWGDYLREYADLCGGVDDSSVEARQLWERAHRLAYEIGSTDWLEEIEIRLSLDPPMN
jgi:hypothetical protein